MDVILEIWQEVLGVPVSATDDFFLDLGGDSLKAMQLTDAVIERTGRECSIAVLFDHPTPAGFVEALQSNGAWSEPP